MINISLAITISIIPKGNLIVASTNGCDGNGTIKTIRIVNKITDATRGVFSPYLPCNIFKI